MKFSLNESIKQHGNEEVHCKRIEEIFTEKNEESEAEEMTENEVQNEQHGTEEELPKFMLEVVEDEKHKTRKIWKQMWRTRF